MPRKYIRKSDRAPLSDDLIRTAQQLLQDGCSTRFAAKVVGASASGLRKRLSRGDVAPSLGRQQTFTGKQENDFVEYCQSVKGSAVTRTDLRELAFEYATANNIRNQFVQASGMAGYDWVRGFLKRHPEVVSRFTGMERTDHHLLDLSQYKATLPSNPRDAASGSQHQSNIEDGLEAGDMDEAPCDASDTSDHSEDLIKIEMAYEPKLAEFQAEEELEFGAARARTQSPKANPLEDIDTGRAEAQTPKTSPLDDFGSARSPMSSKTNPLQDFSPALSQTHSKTSQSPIIYSSHRVAASAPPPLPQSANPIFWPEQPQPKIRPGPGADECQIFGDFVASELRTLRSDESRKRLKRIIQKAILNIGEEEDVNIISG